jgi:uncharacterized protein (TIGR03083 family)
MVDTTDWIAVLRTSHDRLAALLTPLDDTAVEGPSYDDEWSIASVASHLGSQAEIFTLFLDAGISGTAAPGNDAFPPIWDRWNNLAPSVQVAESVAADAKFVARVEGLSESERAGFALSAFGTEMDLTGTISMRLGEHALHTWDIAVALDPTAVVAADAVALLIGMVPSVAGRVGKPTEDTQVITVATVAPERTFTVTTGPELSVTESTDADGALRLPAEAFLRLVYGRLDPEHTPADVTDDTALSTLRNVFPGF